MSATLKTSDDLHHKPEEMVQEREKPFKKHHATNSVTICNNLQFNCYNHLDQGLLRCVLDGETFRTGRKRMGRIFGPPIHGGNGACHSSRLKQPWGD